MSKDLNLCQFIGRLGNDPEIRSTSNGNRVASLSLACGDDYKDKTGNKVEQTNWIRMVVFGRLVDVLEQYCHKGDQLYVSGKQVTRKWQDQNGQDRYSTEVVVDNFQMLGGKSGNQSDLGFSNPAPSTVTTQNGVRFDDDVPF